MQMYHSDKMGTKEGGGDGREEIDGGNGKESCRSFLLKNHDSFRWTGDVKEREWNNGR